MTAPANNDAALVREELAGARYGGRRNLGQSPFEAYAVYVEHPNGPWEAIWCRTEAQARAVAALAAAAERADAQRLEVGAVAQDLALLQELSEFYDAEGHQLRASQLHRAHQNLSAALLAAEQERDEAQDHLAALDVIRETWQERAVRAEATITRLRERLEHDAGWDDSAEVAVYAGQLLMLLAQDTEQGPVPGSTFLPPGAPEPPPGKLIGGYSAAQDAEQETA